VKCRALSGMDRWAVHTLLPSLSTCWLSVKFHKAGLFTPGMARIIIIITIMAAKQQQQQDKNTTNVCKMHNVRSQLCQKHQQLLGGLHW